jgi:hypothetical protein
VKVHTRVVLWRGHQQFFFIKRFESKKSMMTVDDDYDGGNDMQEDLFPNHQLQIDFLQG